MYAQCIEHITLANSTWEEWAKVSVQVAATLAAVAFAWLLTLRNEKHALRVKVAKAKTGLPFLLAEYEAILERAESRYATAETTQEHITRVGSLRDWYDRMSPLVFEVLPAAEFKCFSELKRIVFDFADQLAQVQGRLADNPLPRVLEENTQALVSEARKSLASYRNEYLVISH